MADKRLDICTECSAATWCETRNNGRPQCGGCKIIAFFKWLYKPLGFSLLPWQEKVLRELYGTAQVDTGLRRYRHAYISMSKKNGKSFLIGGLPLFHLLHEDEQRPEAYGAAAAKDQAGIVYRAAAQLARANPAIKDRLKILDSTRRITRRDGAGFYAVLSADGDVQDGIEPSLVLRDELHRWKTEKAHTLNDVLIKGMISRKEPLDIGITTAGEVYKSELCYQEYEFAKRILSGSLKSDRFYAAIWEADAHRLAQEPDYWKSREFRVAANPSHEDLGGFLKDEAIVEELDKAIAIPAKYPDYLRYHGNCWVQDEKRAIDLAHWDACPAPWRAEGWPLSHEHLKRFVDRPCYAGLDLSSSTDLTALSLVFPDGEYADILPFAWITDKAMRQLEGARTHLDGGFLERVEGNLIDYDLMIDRLRWAKEMFDLREVVMDPWNDKGITKLLINEGFLCVEIRQTFAGMSAYTKGFLDSLAAGKLRHGGHPVLRWNADCLTLKSDRDNVMPAKPDRMTASTRIDLIVASIMGHGRAKADQKKPSVYATRPGYVL